MLKKIFSILTAIALLVSCRNTPTEKQSSPEKGVVASHAMVVSAKEEASQIGLAILKKRRQCFRCDGGYRTCLSSSLPQCR